MPYIGFAFTDRALDFVEALPPKVRKQVINKAKGLLANPFPQGSKKLKDVVTDAGEPVYRERSGDYRILYVVRSNPAEVLIIDVDHRKDIYRTIRKATYPADEHRLRESEVDISAAREASVFGPLGDASVGVEGRRLAAHPRKKQ